MQGIQQYISRLHPASALDTSSLLTVPHVCHSDVDESETDEFEAEMATRGGVIPSKRARSAASPRTLYRWERVWSRGRRAHGAKGKAQLWWIVLVGVLNTAIPYVRLLPPRPPQTNTTISQLSRTHTYTRACCPGTLCMAIRSSWGPWLALLLSSLALHQSWPRCCHTAFCADSSALPSLALALQGARVAWGLALSASPCSLSSAFWTQSTCNQHPDKNNTLALTVCVYHRGHGSASDTSVLNIIAGHLILVVAVFCKALASVLAHRHLSHVKLLPLALGQTAASAVAAVAAAFILNFTGVLPARHATQFKFFDLAPGRAYAAIMYLGLASSCAVYLLQFFLIQRAGAVRQLLVDYMTPVVGVVEGVAFRHELRNIGLSAGLCDIAGIACVAAGVALVTTQGGCCRRGYAGDAAALAEVTRPLSSTASRLQRHSAGKTTTGTTAIAGGGRSTSTATTGASAVVVAAVAASNRGVAGGGAATAINGGVAAAVGPSGGGGSGGSSVGIGRSWSGLLGSYEQGFVRKAATSIHGDV